MIKVATSILSADFANLGNEVKAITKAGADYIHIDVMDGLFVPNITIGPVVIKSIKKETTLPFDVHLMINNPERYIEDFAKAGADIVTIHTESTIHVDRTIDLIKSFGIKAGISLVPSTHEASLDYIIEKLDLILVMTVNPGFGGQKFIHSQLQKIENIKKRIDKLNLNTELEVDGGINNETAKLAINAGANVLVSGSYIFSARTEKYGERIRLLKS